VELMRIWRTRVAAGCEDEYERFAAERSLPMFVAQNGFGGLFFGRSDSDCIVVTFWRNEEAVAQLDRSPWYRETVAAIETTGFLVGDASLEVYPIFGSARGEQHEETRDKRAR
jgi:heme-degrading monooxygenase HmoA